MAYVRTATASDAKAIGCLIRGQSADFLVDPSSEDAKHFFSALEPAAIEEMMKDSSRLYLVAVDQEAIIGMIMVREKNYISQFFVAATRQGRGIGRLLWEQALKTIHAAGGMGEFSVNSSLAAQEVYGRFGFVPAGELTIENGFSP